MSASDALRRNQHEVADNVLPCKALLRDGCLDKRLDRGMKRHDLEETDVFEKA